MAVRTGPRRPSVLAPRAQRNVDIALAALLLACAARLTASDAVADTDQFPGWKGEVPRQAVGAPIYSRGVAGFGHKDKEVWRGEVQQVSWDPRVYVYKNFLSDEECDHLIQHAKDRMTKSTVVDNDTGKSVPSSVRTSSGTFYARGQDKVIQAVEERIAHVTFLPEVNGEGLQILHYVNGEKYEPHHDYFHDAYNARPENGGQRIATVLMYLSTPEVGGETVFPDAAVKVTGPGWSDCALAGLAVKAKKGDALMFYSLHPDGNPDPHSLHSSCPTLAGEKWSATKWIHVGEFGGSSEAQRAKWGECIDAEKHCKEWEVMGECTRNPEYMLSYCRLSCGACAKNETRADAGDGATELRR